LWALNFRDVLVAVGAISSQVAGQALGIGGECCGEVVNVGSGVEGLAVGDQVMAVPPDGMGSYLTTDARWVAPSPTGMTPEQAVSGTCVYATAWLGLHWMARIRRGDRVLIHSAAGGVGLAAVHLCLREGCTIYVTASTAQKRSHLLECGATAAFDSRSVTAFTKGVREATGGEGVDVVLNSLSGDAIEASLRLLRPFGRFIELGKRDQYEKTNIGLDPFLGGLTYAAAHFDVLMLRHPDQCRRLLEEVWRELPGLPRLPSTVFQMSELSNALEYFSKGVHIGKVLVAMGEGDVPVLPAYPMSVQGPPGDLVAEALREVTGARPRSPADGRGGAHCVPNLQAVASVEELTDAQVVITCSRAVAHLAAAHAPGALCVELPRWEPVSKASLDEWLALGGNVVAVEEEYSGDLREWLVEMLAEMAGSVRMDDTFEAIGLDSLSLISLARRLSGKVGAMVSVADLFDHPTPRKLLDSFAGKPQPQVSRPKAVCLHGFRSNRDAMSLQVAPFVSAVGEVEWVFVNAPRRASGPPDPKIPAAEAFEWWGQEDGPYETGWMAPHFDGLNDTLPLVKSLSPRGVLGFSQGGAVATLIECAWVALFSAVAPPAMQQQTVPSFHCFDLQEDFASQCMDVSRHYVGSKEVHHHSHGHNVPRDQALVRSFANFVVAQAG
jgi:NADPH:quinone reductase-like Zn-dependent oxidoreductase/aryl carrier-like protein